MIGALATADDTGPPTMPPLLENGLESRERAASTSGIRFDVACRAWASIERRPQGYGPSGAKNSRDATENAWARPDRLTTDPDAPTARF